MALEGSPIPPESSSEPRLVAVAVVLDLVGREVILEAVDCEVFLDAVL